MPQHFIFICSSSGTGKRQLAFSIDIPLIYYNFNEKVTLTQQDRMKLNGQKIYENYLNISRCLMNSIDNDLRILNIKDMKDIIKEKGISEDIPLHFPSLIYNMTNSILEEEKKKVG